MKKVMLTALGATFLMAGGAALANECGLNDRQLSNGWTCTVDTVVADISRVIDNGNNCQDARLTTTVFEAYNPAVNLVEDKSGTLDSEQSDWGIAYPNDGGCNFN